MRLTEKRSQRLIDIQPVQADRLKDPYFAQALERGAFDPFPDGTQALGPVQNRGALARNSGITETEIPGGALSGFDGGLPEHIQEALQFNLHNDDDSLKAFLAIFDRRLMQLDLRVRRAGALVATQDADGQDAPSILDRMLRMVNKNTDDTRYFQLLLPFLSRVRSLNGLRDAVSWLTQRDVRVSVNFDATHPIDVDSRTYLSARKSGNAGLGQGTLLGRLGRTPMGRISIYVACTDRQDLDRIAADSAWLAELKKVITLFLRDPVPVTIYADVMRHMLSAPILSSNKGRADRLGAYNIFQPERAPNQRATIKLSEVSM
jgi:predicted component of type VI protein secretion system